jgi:AraC-type DNA-binding domain-containing proteins
MTEAIQFNKTSKYEIFDLLEAQLNNFTGELQCSMPGLEFLVTPYPVSEISQNHKSHKVLPRSVYIFGGGEGHSEKFNKANGVAKSLVVNPRYVAQFCEPLSLNYKEIEFNLADVVQDETLINRIKLMSELSDSALDPSQFSLDCMASELLIDSLIRQKHSQSEKISKEAHTGYFPGVMPKIKSLLLRNIENPHFNLDLLAQESGLSKFHLIRVFKKSVGMSPAKYFNQVKIDLAKHWLLTSKKSVLSIAMELGFGDLSTFNKAFKRTLGISPSAFRSRSPVG